MTSTKLWVHFSIFFSKIEKWKNETIKRRSIIASFFTLYLNNRKMKKVKQPFFDNKIVFSIFTVTWKLKKWKKEYNFLFFGPFLFFHYFKNNLKTVTTCNGWFFFFSAENEKLSWPNRARTFDNKIVFSIFTVTWKWKKWKKEYNFLFFGPFLFFHYFKNNLKTVTTCNGWFFYFSAENEKLSWPNRARTPFFDNKIVYSIFTVTWKLKKWKKEYNFLFFGPFLFFSLFFE